MSGNLSIDLNRAIAKYFGMKVLNCWTTKHSETGEEFTPLTITVVGIPKLPTLTEWKHEIVVTTVKTDHWIKGAVFVQRASLNFLREYGDIFPPLVVTLEETEDELTKSLQCLNIFNPDQGSLIDGYSYSTSIHIINNRTSVTLNFYAISYGLDAELDKIWDALVKTSKAILKRSKNRRLETYFLQYIERDDI